MAPYVLAHLSDPHLGPLPRPRLGELLGKRATGFFNWRRRRHALHRSDILECIVADLKAQRPNHIAVTGDLVNIALPGEFPPARNWLESIGPPADVSLVPGNHDAYVRRAARHPQLHWGDYMRGDDGFAPGPHAGAFPFVRRRGPLVLIGLSSAVPTPPFMATGRLGADQIARLDEMLARFAPEPMFRVVLIHHPPLSKRSERFKRLTDGDAFCAVLKRRGAELVLHGHDHVDSVVMLAGPRGKIPSVGVPSASQRRDGRHDPAAYHLYRIDARAGTWRCEMVTRGVATHGDDIVEHRRQMLAD
jgi:3',5'-cyclic AMP phosphodiesterase CpdA